MPRYFFDIDDGDHGTSDNVGIELADDEAARKEAIATLPEVARDVLPDGDRREFVALVRDESGQSVFRATLSLSAAWLNPDGTPRRRR